MRLYHLFLYPDRVVGPYNLHCLREWLAMGIITAEYQVCLAGTEAWTPLSGVAEHDVISPRLQRRMDARRANLHPSWWEQPASERQRAKLDYFAIPYSAEGLTKARASELLGYFVQIDPTREENYRRRPADAGQIAVLQALGENGRNLDHDGAKTLIAETQFRKWMDELEERSRREKHDGDLMILDDHLNDEDVREICHYKKVFSRRELESLLTHLNQSMPDWRRISRFELGDYVAQHVLHKEPTAKGRKPAIVFHAPNQEDRRSTRNIYLRVNDQQHGPFGQQEVLRFWEQAEIDDASCYWCEGMPEWQPVTQLL